MKKAIIISNVISPQLSKHVLIILQRELSFLFNVPFMELEQYDMIKYKLESLLLLLAPMGA
jgi:hypothetical protein